MIPAYSLSIQPSEQDTYVTDCHWSSARHTVKIYTLSHFFYIEIGVMENAKC